LSGSSFFSDHDAHVVVCLADERTTGGTLSQAGVSRVAGGPVRRFLTVSLVLVLVVCSGVGFAVAQVPDG